MRPALSLRLGQHLALTPQLQQALRLLAMPAAELELELRAALDQNPMLCEGGADEGPEDDPLAARTTDATSTQDVDPDLNDEAPFAGQERSSADDAVDADWDSAELVERGAGGGAREPAETGQTAPLDLRSHLIEQLDECRFTHVAAVGHQAGELAKVALALQQCCSHGRNGRHLGGVIASLFGADLTGNILITSEKSLSPPVPRGEIGH